MHDIRIIYRDHYPYLLRQIEKTAPFLYVQGSLPPDNHKVLCVVGSRSPSQYGVDVCTKLIHGLAGYPITIVSGLAIGIDSLAHECAIEAGLHTISFPGSGLHPDVLYPRSRTGLAQKILSSGGALVSSFKLDQKADRWTFPVRNQIMAGVSHAILVIEARPGSGSLITAAAASDINRDLLAVPGSIFSELSHGTNALLRDGAIAVCSPRDILELLNLTETDEADVVGTGATNAQKIRLSDLERSVLEIASSPKTRDEILEFIDISIGDLNSIITRLEISGFITERDGRISLR